MAEFHREGNGTGWLRISWLDLVEYSGNTAPVCDECLTDLVGDDDIILLLVLNQAYCYVCGEKVLSRLINHPGDAEHARRKERFWLNYFGIQEVAQNDG